jgi:hypothetical protein
LSGRHGKKKKQRLAANRAVAVPDERLCEEPCKPAPQSETSDHAKEKNCSMYKPPDSTLALWGVLLGAVVALIYFMQWFAMDQAMKVDQRAWVGPMIVQHMHAIPETGVRVQLTLSNSGRTPAFISRIQKNSQFMDGNLTELPPDAALKEDFSGRAVVFPNQPGIGVDIPAPDYGVDDMNAIRDKKKTLNFYGMVEYSDIFGKGHFTKFCYHYVVTWGPLPFEGFVSCKKYNDTDDVEHKQ